MLSYFSSINSKKTCLSIFNRRTCVQYVVLEYNTNKPIHGESCSGTSNLMKVAAGINEESVQNQQTNGWRELLQYQQCDEKLLKELTKSQSNTSKLMHRESCSSTSNLTKVAAGINAESVQYQQTNA
jgi:hypothetical protein